MSPFVKRLQQWTVLFALCAIVFSGGHAQATDPPFGLAGVAGESIASIHEVPSSGAMNWGATFDLPPNRGAAQPHLALRYASGARAGEAGWGWSLDLPSIERAPLSGWPKYLDNGNLSDEDRYAFNGDPLTFICVVGSCSGDAQLGPTTGMAEISGYRYYRRQVESGFERFFLSPDRSTWVVQRRGGEILELGYPLTRPDLVMSSPIDLDNSTPTSRAFRWNLAVQRDLHGDKNIVYYQWAHDGFYKRKYLRDIFYAPPAAATSTAPTGAFAYHVELRWENPPYSQEDYTFPDKRPQHRRLRRVAISAKTWGNEGDRELVRAYNLAYHDVRTVPGSASEAPLWGRSSLKSVQLEGRCAAPVAEYAGYLPDPTGCPTLPPTTFGYQQAEINLGTATRTTLPGSAEGGVYFVTSASLIDIDRNGLADVVSTWPTNSALPGPGAITFPFYYPGCDADFRINIGDPNNPRLACPDGPTVDHGAGRRHNLWLNQGHGGGAAGPLGFSHNCLDAGPVLSLAMNTIMHFQTSTSWLGPEARPPSLFTRYGNEVVADWGNGILLWSMANYGAYRIRPGQPGDYTQAEFDSLCPEGGGAPMFAPNGDAAYPTHVWAKPASPSWAKEMYPLPDTGTLHYRTIDVDGDGYPDLLRQSAQGGEANGFARAQVNFTRRVAASEQYVGPAGTVPGPALLPLRIVGGAPTDEVTSVSSHAKFQAEGDINGDGIPDLLVSDLLSFASNTEAHVRLGDGRGGFGCDPVEDVACTVPGNGSWVGPAYRLYFPDAEKPWPLQLDSPYHFASGNPSSHRVHFLQDVTGDGLSDLVAFSPSEDLGGGATQPGRIQLWINVDGRTFRCATSTDCVVGTVSDLDAPGYVTGLATPVDAAHRIVITDFDGNGVQDFVLIGQRGIWTFPFLSTSSSSLAARAPRPGLLTRIDNGVGARTEVTYETIQELDRAAAALETSFQRAWGTHVPSVLPVVTRITTRDSSTAIGVDAVQPFFVNRVRKYEYHDPAYDPWERSLKGFAIVRSIEASTNVVEQRWFYFGRCEGGPFIDSSCYRGSDGGYSGEAERVYRQKALVGALVRVDRFIPGSPGNTATQWLSTTTTKYLLDRAEQEGGEVEWITPSADPSSGLRDREVTWARPARVDTYLYDPTIEVTAVESIGDPREVQYAPAQSGAKRLRVDTSYDAQGNVSTVTRFGRVAGAGGDTSEDDQIVTRLLPEDRCQANWACRVATTQVADKPLVGGVLGSERLLRSTHHHYTATEDVDWISADLFTVGGTAPNELARNLDYGAGPPTDAVLAAAGGAAGAPNVILRRFDHDTFGNVTRVRGMDGANQACTTTVYDGAFAQFPEMVATFKGGGCTGSSFKTEQLFDRGLGVPTATLYPTETMEMVEHDPFGRAAKMYAPVANGGPMATELSVEIFHHTQAPLPYVAVRRHVGVDQMLESFEIMNGIGEHVMGFDQADSVLDPAPWILRDWTERDEAGHPGGHVPTVVRGHRSGRGGGQHDDGAADAGQPPLHRPRPVRSAAGSVRGHARGREDRSSAPGAPHAGCRAGEGVRSLRRIRDRHAVRRAWPGHRSRRAGKRRRLALHAHRASRHWRADEHRAPRRMDSARQLPLRDMGLVREDDGEPRAEHGRRRRRLALCLRFRGPPRRHERRPRLRQEPLLRRPRTAPRGGLLAVPRAAAPGGVHRA